MSMEIAGTAAGISSGFRRVVDVFLAGAGLPFSQILSAERIERICGAQGCLFGQNRIYSTPVVLWAWLSQVLRDGKEAACQAAVASIVAACLERGEAPPTEDTGDYCRSRAKLAPQALKAISREATIKRLDNRHVDSRLRLALLRKLEGKQIDGSVRAGLEQMCVNAWSGKLLACLAAIDPASWQAAPDARGRAEKLLLAAAADSDPRLLDRVPAVASSLGVPTPKLAEPHPLAKAADVAALLGAADPARGAKLFADARQVAAAP